MGCRGNVELYSLKNDQWKMIGGPEFYACGDTIPFRKRIKRISDSQIIIWGDEVDGSGPKAFYYYFRLNNPL
jgi:hypothetical protein